VSSSALGHVRGHDAHVHAHDRVRVPTPVLVPCRNRADVHSGAHQGEDVENDGRDWRTLFPKEANDERYVEDVVCARADPHVGLQVHEGRVSAAPFRK
jgi:hypothetical protein